MIKSFAHVVSFLMHPLLIGLYGMLLMVSLNPFAFGNHNATSLWPILAQYFYIAVFLPVIGIAVLRFTGLINSFRMETHMERIGPLMLTGVFYIWVYINFDASAGIPMAAKIFTFGAAIALFAAFLCTIFTKISLHAVAAGALVLFCCLTFIPDLHLNTGQLELSFFIWDSIFLTQTSVLLAIILLAGASLTSRLILNAHSLSQVSGGFVVGLLSMLVAYIYLT